MSEILKALLHHALFVNFLFLCANFLPSKKMRTHLGVNFILLINKFNTWIIEHV